MSKKEKKTNYLGLVLTHKNQEKFNYISEVFGVSKTKIAELLFHTSKTLHQLYDDAKEYRKTYDEDEGLDVGWLAERRIIL